MANVLRYSILFGQGNEERLHILNEWELAIAVNLEEEEVVTGKAVAYRSSK